MQIIKYASKNCVKCKVLDRILSQIKLPCEVQTIYAEDNAEELQKLNIELLPTLRIINQDKEDYLEGIISPKQIIDSISRLS